MRKLKSKNLGGNITCTYFPYGDFYQVFCNYRSISEEEPTAIEALESALSLT